MASGIVERRGTVVRGHRVASGVAGDARFPGGTIAPQLRFLREHIDGFDAYLGGPPFAGTVNVAFADARVVPGTPDFVVGPVRWTAAFPPERFLISRCAIVHDGSRYPAFLYIPDPATKPDHHQASNVVELLARRLPGLAYGDALSLLHSAGSLAIVGGG